jgi:hypothetical protein
MFFQVPSRAVQCQISRNLFVSEMPDVGSRNLRLTTPDSLQKESAQSDHPALRKRPKYAEILGYFNVVQKQQNQTTFWTFSPGVWSD